MCPLRGVPLDHLGEGLSSHFPISSFTRVHLFVQSGNCINKLDKPTTLQGVDGVPQLNRVIDLQFEPV